MNCDVCLFLLLKPHRNPIGMLYLGWVWSENWLEKILIQFEFIGDQGEIQVGTFVASN